MKSKRFLQIFALFVILFSPLGSVQPVSASNGPAPQQDAVVIDRNLNYWDATYYGFVSSAIYENWRFEFTASHEFVVTVTRVSGDLVPVIVLLDGGGTELARGVSSLTSSQPAGSYSFQIQPETGMGLYMLTLREVGAPSQSSATTVVVPATISVGETAGVTVSLDNVPPEGYASTEFTCTYNANLVELGDITVTELFGTDPVMAVTTPQGGNFIIAIAGSNGRKATASGAAFAFSVDGLQAGQTGIECVARVSKGDGALTQLPSNPASLNILMGDETPTPTFTPTPYDTLTATPTESPTSTSTPDETPTPTSTPDESPTPTSTPDESPTPTSTPDESPTPTFTTTPEPSATPDVSPTPTSTPQPTTGTLTGKVLAGKLVTVALLNTDGSVAASAPANTDGTFSLTAPAGTYTVRATADGFLRAQGTVTLAGGETATKPEITLLAGDIDNNDVIDAFDALTIGMSYNTATPAAADLNNDGIINVLDLELLARNYRAMGPLEW